MIMFIAGFTAGVATTVFLAGLLTMSAKTMGEIEIDGDELLG